MLSALQGGTDRSGGIGRLRRQRSTGSVVFRAKRMGNFTGMKEKIKILDTTNTC